jgi:hypothetical protein
VPAVDHNARNVINGIVTLLTQGTIVFVQKLVDELVDLFAIEVRRVLSLLKKERRWVLQFFHLIQKYISPSALVISHAQTIAHLKLSKIMVGASRAQPVLLLAQKLD